jgi:Ca-activated chloride channel family protein
MEFALPAALALALLALPVAWLARRRARGYSVPSISPVVGIQPSWRLRAARALPALRVLAVLALAIAVAGPRKGNATAAVPGEGIDIALALDISSSMSQRFGNSTRLDVTRDVIREFIKGRENDRIGLVVFQKDAMSLSPPSLDYEALDRMVADVESGLLPDGTGIGVGLANALNMLQDSTAASRVVILLTDGEHNADSISPEEAAQLAVALKIRVYTIGVVSGSSPFNNREIDEALLRDIAERTNARYFTASSPEALADVYEEIGSLETSRISRESFERFTELAPWFAGAAAGLLLLELVLRGTVLRRSPA